MITSWIISPHPYISGVGNNLQEYSKRFDSVLEYRETELTRTSKSTLHLVLRLRGGAKKRKKKNYTTPKKIKHKHKKVKLPVLKYYKVDDNGKITRQRRECPSEECGAGIFMANMFDRQYCGRCHLTYVFNKPE
ncbi:Ubiquitin-40S ribosomal protein S27a [Armadillidium vulgare]|nr:Ubiquitin-40S ribosomal protein S27a [Armadillidium vulgare]